MHNLVIDNLEAYLTGTAAEVDVHAVEQHLADCAPCRQEVSVMRLQAELVRSLRAESEREPRPGMYMRVMEQIEQQRRSSFWNLFQEPLFAKRIVYASLTLLLLCGGYLFTLEDDSLIAGDRESTTISLEDQRQLGEDPQRDREAVLVNLATYQD